MTITGISMCFSRNVQGGLGSVQPLAHPGVLPRESGELGGEPPNLLAGPFARQHPRVALLTHSLINDEYKPSRRK